MKRHNAAHSAAHSNFFKGIRLLASNVMQAHGAQALPAAPAADRNIIPQCGAQRNSIVWLDGGAAIG